MAYVQFLLSNMIEIGEWIAILDPFFNRFDEMSTAQLTVCQPVHMVDLSRKWGHGIVTATYKERSFVTLSTRTHMHVLDERRACSHRGVDHATYTNIDTVPLNACRYRL